MDKEYFFQSDQLTIWRPTGMLGTDKIYEFIRFLNESSERKTPYFNRFIDLSQISGISIAYQDLHPIAQQRKEYYSANIKQIVKMAILVNNPLSYGMARMYQMLSDEPHFEVNICENREEAAQFLEVDISVIIP